jgi:uncharacterized protein
MRILLAGASGLIGRALRSSLQRAGHEVSVLVRRPPADPSERQWDPADALLDPTLVEGVDAAICLSGAGVGDHRWTPDYKATLVASRMDSVGTMSRTLAAHNPSAVLISASAVGYYGDTGDQAVDESAAAGSGFLADLCVRWEDATEPAVQAGLRVATLRTGLVLSGDGGLLARLKPIVSLGIGGRLGSGRQYMSWIALDDEIRAIEFLLTHEVSGPVNLTAPDPVTNSAFVEALGRILHRPTVLPTPAFALRLALGEFAQDTLTGQRALPHQLITAGFTFSHAELDSALHWALGR